MFSKPGGTEVKNQLIRLIDGSEHGSIYLTTFLFRDKDVAESLTEAAERGVGVKVIADYRSLNKHPNVYKAFDKAMKDDGKDSTWAKLCSKGTGCIGNKGSAFQHSKFALFSNTLRQSKVTFITTANLTGNDTVGGIGGWNSAYTRVGNDGLYDRMHDFFYDLKAEKKNDDYYNTNKPDTDKNVKTYFHPRQGANTFVNILEGVDCNKGALIRIDSWWLAKTDIAKKLWEMGRTGCGVQIVANQISEGACKALTKKDGGYDGPQIRGFAAGKREHGTHGKNMTIVGNYLDKNRHITFTGSANFTPSSLEENDEVTARIADKTIHNLYADNMVDIWNKATVRDRDCKKLAPADTKAAAEAEEDS
ncbi:phosphatidylserine/phosphatidylglycerophosphate/cardiolipin synthase family protein [Streptomyces sp. NPDC048441]|uniref:phospholipase D-like domain-containing protein n=1 Tax=Streptomyces sp. NPDC048441 TaxID=3365552 RepID=UPI00371D3D53